MKNILRFLLIFSLCIGFASCNKKEPQEKHRTEDQKFSAEEKMNTYLKMLSVGEESYSSDMDTFRSNISNSLSDREKVIMDDIAPTNNFRSERNFQIDDKLSFIIANCSYSEDEDEFKNELEKYYNSDLFKLKDEAEKKAIKEGVEYFSQNRYFLLSLMIENPDNAFRTTSPGDRMIWHTAFKQASKEDRKLIAKANVAAATCMVGLLGGWVCGTIASIVNFALANKVIGS